MSQRPVIIAYIGGGSLNWATKLMADLAHDTALEAHVRLYAIDPAAAERNAKIGARFGDVSKGAPAQYKAVPSLKDALTGADVVVVSILPGEFDDMAHDVGIPARYGIKQAVGDRHLAEFVPQSDYLDTAQGWDFALTPAPYRVRDRAEKRARANALAAEEGTPYADRPDEALVDQNKGLMGLGDFVSNVNLPNRGQMDGLPAGTIVETNALFSSLGVTPLVAGRLLGGLHEIVADRAARQSARIAAVFENLWDDLFDLFRTNPLAAPLRTDVARQMFQEVVQATSHHLPRDLLREAS